MKELFEGIWLMPAEDLTHALNVFLAGFVSSIVIGASIALVLVAVGALYLWVIHPKIAIWWERRRVKKAHRRRHF